MYTIPVPPQGGGINAQLICQVCCCVTAGSKVFGDNGVKTVHSTLKGIILTGFLGYVRSGHGHLSFQKSCRRNMHKPFAMLLSNEHTTILLQNRTNYGILSTSGAKVFDAELLTLNENGG